MQTTDRTPDDGHEQVRDHVLVVDDDSGVRNMQETVLTNAGFEVTTAADAEEAFAVVAEHSVQVAIVDISLPGMNGLELCTRLASEHGIDVLLITGDDVRYSYEDAVRSGASDFILKPIRPRELILRIERTATVRRTRIDRDKSLRDLRRLSITDDLTGLFNARHFFQQLPNELNRAARYGHAVSLIVLDLDHFKRVNDAYGHQEGDRVLQHVATIIRSAIRESDTAYRYGGEEFAIVLPETAADSAMLVAERLRQAMPSMPVASANGDLLRITGSMGIAQREEAEDAQSFLKRADMAMYAAKQEGRNRIVSATLFSNSVSIDSPCREKGEAEKASKDHGSKARVGGDPRLHGQRSFADRRST